MALGILLILFIVMGHDNRSIGSNERSDKLDHLSGAFVDIRIYGNRRNTRLHEI